MKENEQRPLSPPPQGKDAAAVVPGPCQARGLSCAWGAGELGT